MTRTNKKALKHIPVVSEQQVEFCQRLGISVAGDTVSVALAKLEDAIDTQFHGKTDLSMPTDRQIALAAQFGFDISSWTRREAEAIIADIMMELNFESIEEQGLASGVSVVNRWDRFRDVEVISSIHADGTVFLKGGNGKRAWARNLKRIESRQE